MIYLSAGHSKSDPGAVASGLKEADLTMELRNLVAAQIGLLTGNLITDKDNESLAEYLRRIKPGDGSVVCELHFNASVNKKATGVETIVPERADPREIALARELSAAINKHTGLMLRGSKGVTSESESHRGRLGLMREAGLNALVEVCFISNPSDMRLYRKGIQGIARDIAAVLVKYDALIK